MKLHNIMIMQYCRKKYLKMLMVVLLSILCVNDALKYNHAYLNQ